MATKSKSKIPYYVAAPKKESAFSTALKSQAANVLSAAKPNTAASKGTSVSPQTKTSIPYYVAAPQKTTSSKTATATSNLSNNFGVPLRNDLQANNGTGYNTVSRLNSSGSINPDSVQASSSVSRSVSPAPGTNFNSQQGNTLSSVVNSQLKPTSEMNLARTKADDYLKDYSYDIPGITAPQETDLQKATNEKDDVMQKMLDSMNDTPNTVEIDRKLRNQLQIEQKQQAVSDLSGQLNAIVAKGQANQLAQVGQGRGIPEAIIGGIQAQIGRETAIAALPVQAQLEAAQGNLEMANDSLDRLFKIYSDDAQNQYNARNKMYEVVYDYADKKEQRLLDEKKLQNERAYQESRDLYAEQNTYAKMAFETGQSSLGAKISKLDYKSPTFKTDLANLTTQIVDTKRTLEIQKLQADLANSGSTINPKVLGTTQFKNAQAAQNLKITLEEAKAAVEKYGNYEQMSGTGKGILDTLKIRLASQISTALEQGVVMPGEMENFQKVAGQLQSSIFTRNSKTLGSINSLVSAMDARIALQKAAITNTYNVSDEQVDTLLNITNLSDQEFVDMDAIIE